MKNWKKIRKRFKQLTLLVPIVFVFSVLGFIWYRHQDRPVQEKVESVVLDVIDVFRENRETPTEVRHLLDRVVDRIPLMVGVVVDPVVSDSDTQYIVGGLPESERRLRLLENEAFLVGYDEKRRNPAWVAYRLFHRSDGFTGERPDSFLTDLRTGSRVDTGDFTGSGFDRGHLAPNFGIAWCYGRHAQLETFFMSNIVPQNPQLNRGVWKDLEQRVIKRYTRRFDEVWVITGPVFSDAEKPKTLPEGIEVPDAFYKIIVDQVDDGVRCLALMLPNHPEHRDYLTPYLTSVAAIERVTALNFFPDFDSAAARPLETSPAKRVW